jgi:hypothetical protein
MFGLGNALGLAGWARFPDEDDVLAGLEGYVSDATLADRTVAAGLVISAAAAILAAVMVRTLSGHQSERAATMAAAAAYAPYAGPAHRPPPPSAWRPPSR